MPKKDEFSVQRFQNLNQTQQHELLLRSSLLYFCQFSPIVVDDKPIDFVRHPYETDMLADAHPNQTWQKSAQMGASFMAINRALWSAYYHLPHGVLYLIPTRTDVLDFSKKKFAKVVGENPVYQDWIKDTDAANLKKVGKSFILFRGMQSSVGLKVQDVDMLIYDEIEEATESSVALAEKRVSHSEFKWRLRLSVPSDNDMGINRYFIQSDERHWLIKCKACNTDVCMEDEFPNCLITVGDKTIRACPKCRREIFPQDGRWVAKKPSVTNLRGYQLSQLWSYFVDPGDILEEYQTTKNVAGFYNNTLGLPYTDVSARLTKEQVYACMTQDLMVERDPGPCMMGVDPGKVCHVVIGKKISGTMTKVIRVGVVTDALSLGDTKLSVWDQLAKLIKRYNVTCCVIDGRPYISDCRTLAEKLPGKVWLYFNSDNQRGAALWKDQDWTVNINACEAMDSSHNILLQKRTLLPRRSLLMETFASHCHGTGRKLEENPETGDRHYYWKKLNDDHFRRAFNLMVLAADRTGIPQNRSYENEHQSRRVEGYG